MIRESKVWDQSTLPNNAGAYSVPIIQPTQRILFRGRLWALVKLSGGDALTYCVPWRTQIHELPGPVEPEILVACGDDESVETINVTAEDLRQLGEIYLHPDFEADFWGVARD